MSDDNNETGRNIAEQQAAQAQGGSEPAHTDTMTAKIVYILYFLSLLTGITIIVGLIIAYVNKGEGPEWLQNHYRFQIRTFWIGLLYSVISFLLIFVAIGFVLIVAVMIWFIIRCAVGWKYLARGEPLPNVESWLLGTL